MAMASVKSTSTRASVAIHWSVGDCEGEVDQVEAGGPEHRAEQQEDGDLGNPGALDQPGQERRDQDDDADQRQRGGEASADMSGSMEAMATIVLLSRAELHCEERGQSGANSHRP